MRTELWQRVDSCLANALDLPVESREIYLRAQLAGEEEALAEALKLCAGAAAAERLFEKGPVSGWSGLVAGARLGPWELLRPLGTGGMGVVWLAQRADGQAKMRAAIKLLPPALSGPIRGDGDLLRRFLMEKQILARLEHPNIARLLDASAGAGDTPNFVMEYVEGAPLMEFVKADAADRLALFLKICGAVAYAHANLVIHRDLKPQNILIDGNGEPKLLDFGIARILNDPAGDASVTLRRAFSLDYASPEQIRGGVISTATDVYSLGLILFEMMTGERARRWNDRSLGEVLEESGRFTLPRVEGMGADLAAVLAKATAVDVALRYPSVTDLAADVARVMEGWPVEARPVGLFYRLACFARRNVWTVVSSGLALLLILGLAVWGMISAQRAEQRSTELARSLEAEQKARQQGEIDRKRAEVQGGLAQQMSRLAKQREGEAEARLQELLRAFDVMVTSAQKDVSKLPGGLNASIQLIERALEQLDRMQVSELTRANFLLLRAESYGRLAELYGGPNSSLGDVNRRRKHRETSVRIWKELAALDRGKLDWERGWIEAQFRVELETLPKLMDETREEWKRWERRFLDLRRRAGPKDQLTAAAVGTYYFYRSNSSTVKNPTKRTDLEAALRHFSAAGASGPSTGSVARNMALAHKYLAGIVEISIEERLRHAKEALRLDRTRADQDQNDTGAQLDLGFSMVAVADSSWAAGEEQQALRLFREGYELRKRLALQDAKNVFAQRALAYPARRLGEAAETLKDWTGLEYALKELSWVVERADSKMPNSDMGLLAYWRGLLARNEGKAEAACREFDAAWNMIGPGDGAQARYYRKLLEALRAKCAVAR